jgi:hypothetical protein
MTKLKTKREIREWLNATVVEKLPIVWQERVIDPWHPFFVEPQRFGEEQLVTLVRVNDSDYEEDEREKIFLIKPYNMYIKVTREKIKGSYQCTYQIQYKAEEVEPYEFKETRFKTKVVNKQLAIDWIKLKIASQDATLFLWRVREGRLRDYIYHTHPYNKEEWDRKDYDKFCENSQQEIEEILEILDIKWIQNQDRTIISIPELGNKFYWLKQEKLVEMKPVEQTVINYVPVVAT